MTANGKRARRETGLNRYGVRRVNHTQKSEAKIRRMGWTRERKE